MLLLSLLIACKPTPPDLSERLESGETRAGVIENSDALFGGISAEGRIGDIKIYNDRAQFIIQGQRAGGYYISQGGVPIDADIVRPPNQPGRDIIDEWGAMFGIGRLLNPDSIEIVSDGSDGSTAHVRVSGQESPMALLTGAIEVDIIQDKGVSLVTDYRLEPDTPLLYVESTLTAEIEPIEFKVGDILMGSLDASDIWIPGHGLSHHSANEWPWVGYAGRMNEVAIGIFSANDQLLDAGGGTELLLELATLAIGMQETITLEQGESFTFGRYYGVGRDLAELTDAWQEEREVPTQDVGGTVTASDGPVAGARVNILIDDSPYTLAFTDETGQFKAQVPTTGEVRFLAEGRGTGVSIDLPEGYGPYSPYSADTPTQTTLQSMKHGAPPVPAACGRGVADPSNPLVLGTPGKVKITATDDLPFAAILSPTSSFPSVDSRLVMPRVTGDGVAGWSRDGSIEICAAPGSYNLLAHRGLRWEIHTENIEIEAEKTRHVRVALEAAYQLDEWLIGDPHTHASPSADGSIPMADRLVVAAATGVQIHFGTDHDHVADYRPLLKPLGLEKVLASIVSDEVSPVLRGHHNVYPIEPHESDPNGGAWPWWSNRVSSTDEAFATIREKHPDALIQLNHPTSNGIPDMAKWSPGKIGEPSKWTENFDAVEVLNSFEWQPFFDFYVDTINRGIVSTPTGVSDSHGYLKGGPGYNVTFLHVGHNDPQKLTPADLKTAMLNGKTVVSMGPFIETNILPGSLVNTALDLEITVHAPSWIQIDQLKILENGVVIDTIQDPQKGQAYASTPRPEQDAWYTVIASGSQPMSPISSRTPWAMTAPIFVDVDNNGWNHPLPKME